MGNALTRASETAMAAAGDFNPFSIAGAGSVGNALYMKFNGQTGSFTFGQDNDELDHGSKLAMDIDNTRWAWTFWWDEKVLETIEARIWDDPEGHKNEPDELPESYEGDMNLAEIRTMQNDRSQTFSDGWTCAAIVGLREVGGEQREFTLRLNRGVALNSYLGLLALYGRKFKLFPDQTPIVEFDVNKYKAKAKGAGWRFAPTFKIDGWMTEEDLVAAGGGDATDYDAPDAEPAEGSAGDDSAEPDKASDAAAADTPVDQQKPARGRRRRGNF